MKTSLINSFNIFLAILPVTEETKATEQTTIGDIVVVVEETTDISKSTPKDDWEATTESLFGLWHKLLIFIFNPI